VQEEMHQEDMELDISSSTFGSKNCEVQQTQKNTQELVGTSRRSDRQRKPPA
ncbi:hypothetical protein KI387_007201, partial [Taxus chinensis]